MYSYWPENGEINNMLSSLTIISLRSEAHCAQVSNWQTYSIKHNLGSFGKIPATLSLCINILLKI